MDGRQHLFKVVIGSFSSAQSYCDWWCMSGEKYETGRRLSHSSREDHPTLRLTNCEHAIGNDYKRGLGRVIWSDAPERDSQLGK